MKEVTYGIVLAYRKEGFFYVGMSGEHDQSIRRIIMAGGFKVFQ